jgi:sialic acid synthase SpsE
VKKGEIATRENIRALRPNTGGPIGDIQEILGKKFRNDYSPGDAATIDRVE